MVYLGLGSNLCDPIHQVQQGLKLIQDHLGQISTITEFSASSLVKTPPLANMDQPDYINAVCRFKTTLEPENLLVELRKIEDQQGRERKEHWGPRTLDIDILIYGELQLNSDTLTLPHPGIHEREFVLVPLLELSPNLKRSDGISYQSLLDDYYTSQPKSLSFIP
jgi:2-amino-4-hydroxy-6-hydroxymethyldihydropteridine diphosphokinase